MNNVDSLMGLSLYHISFILTYLCPFTVNIQNFELISPALSRSNSLRIKKDTTKDDLNSPKLSTGTRQLKAHELTYFGIKSTKSTSNTTDTNIITTNKSPFMHLSSSSTNNNRNLSKKSSNNHNTNNSSVTNANATSTSSKIIINHQKPDLIMHHHNHLHQQPNQPAMPQLTSSEKKTMMETLDSCIDETKSLEPLYENLYQNNNNNTSNNINNKQQYDRKLDLARDEKILDELTRAADEIMNVSTIFIFITYTSQSVACNLSMLLFFYVKI